MEATLALMGALLFGIACGGNSSGPLFANLVRDGHWSRLLRGPFFFGFYVLGGLAVLPFVGVFQDLWDSVGVLSAAGGLSDLYVAIAMWVAAALLGAGTLLKFPLSAWHLLLASHLGVGIAGLWGFVHIDRFGNHFLAALIFGPAVAFLIAFGIRFVIARIATATHFHIYAGAEPVTVVPRGDNPLTSMMAMQSLTMGHAETDALVPDLREQTNYRDKGSGRSVSQIVEGLRDMGLALHLFLRGIWDIGIVSLAIGMSISLSDGSLVILALATVMLGVVLVRGHGAGTVVALGGSASKEASLASQWAAALALPIGAWFGIFFVPNQVSCAAFSGAGTLRQGGIQRLAGIAMVWVASVSLACALAAITVYLYDKVGT